MSDAAEAVDTAACMTRGMMMGPAKFAEIAMLLLHLKRTAPAEYDRLRAAASKPAFEPADGETP